ncbi:hypothetical protein MKW98_023137 [Papaver atlanticum]|uniref:26S proteasome non-ATPase regulatory subunit 3 N-terminal TPR repeats domain-containing protein n=1 Tax=Papaver atlanticum TaxID=357466 RepID=A0AAD4XR95_9MAGN|nr:hypothetical protein MKW98_023137 [Papaver atlanticum]
MRRISLGVMLIATSTIIKMTPSMANKPIRIKRSRHDPIAAGDRDSYQYLIECICKFRDQFCRYLFYLGKIRTIQLEYTDAKESLLQAARKAPVLALGFRVQCNN